MKVLIIPDCHLKPNMFRRASALMEIGVAEQAVYLGDTADDWESHFQLHLYQETYDALIDFVKKYPSTKVCYGNHDLSYLWYRLETGYTPAAEGMVNRKMMELANALPEDNPIQYVHRIDNVLFSHGGVGRYFVDEHVTADPDDIDEVLAEINEMEDDRMWNDASPIWLRPQYGAVDLFLPDQFLQVVGHTPVETAQREGNLISCDLFSTYRNGKPIGTQEYVVLDTATWEFTTVK